MGSLLRIPTLFVSLACAGSSGSVAFGQEAAESKTRLRLENTSGDLAANFGGDLETIEWASDGVHYVRTVDGKQLWIHPETGESSVPAAEQVDEREALRQQFSAALAKLPGMSESDASSASRSSARFSEDGASVAANLDGDLLFFRRGEEKPLRLTARAAPKELLRLSPDGQFASYVAEGNLYVVETGTATEHAVSDDGSEGLLYGKLDWVYQEEIYGRGNFNAQWWSPDSRHLAFLRIDESNVHPFTVIDHIPTRLEVETTNYPKAGDPNPTASLGAVRARDGRIVWMDLSRYDGSQFLISSVGWSPDGRQVVYQVQDREQTWLDLNLANPATGESKTLFRENSETWVESGGDPRWLADGSFLWFSDRSGYRHLYRYSATGELLGQVTDGSWNVDSLLFVNEDEKWLDFLGRRDGAINVNAYRVGLDGSGLTRLTPDDGTHRVQFNADRSYFLDTHSSLDTPPRVRLCKSDGTVQEVLAESVIPDLDKYEYAVPELFEISTRDGFKMDATLIRPPGFRESGLYPVWLHTYSGPNAPSVRNRWNTSPWFQFLAQQEILVFQVNNRTSSGKGKVTTDHCYQQLGVQELQDLEDAIGWLCDKPWADGDRVGISGWSYGGFMTAYALTHSDRFRVGIAGAGVYDWRDYDTIYTERYMRTPQNNPEGYSKTSCIEAAADLSGHLLLVHGTMDDNVHLQNAIQFAYALQIAGQDFDLMLYPKSRHRIVPELRWHLRQREWQTIEEHLLVSSTDS